MSYCFDTMVGVYRQHVYPLLQKDGKEDLAMRFELLIEAMHSANHDVPSKDGVFKGDGINKHPSVSAAARKLDECAQKYKPQIPGS